MADNVAITAGTGTTVAADEVVDGTLGTVKVQYVKIMDATLDGTTKAAVSAQGLKSDLQGIGGSAVVASVTGVQNVMPVKRTGATGLAPNYTASHITTNATTTPTAATAYLTALVIACSGAGTAWTLKVQNKEGTAKILVPNFTLTVPTTGSPIMLQFPEPILMTSGIDIITAGTTPGIVDVFATYWQ